MAKKHDEKLQPGDESAETRQQMTPVEEPSRIQERVAYVTRLFEDRVTVRTLLESVGEGVIVIDQDGTIALVNKRIEELFGYSREEVVGHPLSILLPERFIKAHDQHIAEYFKDPHIRLMGQGFDLTAKCKDGTELPVEISLSFLNTEAGSLSMAFVTDISLRKQAESALQQRNEELDAYAHTVAHDLNAPLSLLIGYGQLLVEEHETLPDEELHRLLELIAQTGRKMGKIVAELLLLARVRKEDVVPMPLDMTDIVGEAIKRVQYLAEEHQAEIITPDSYPRALGHAPWVEEVWVNYFSNGLKYGGQPPRLRVGSTVQDDGYVKFWVQDNGPGLTAEQQAQLFAPYTQLENLRIEGHGLGLSIARGIVEKLDGQVGVESEVGRGSVFSFTLPGEEKAQ